MAETAEQKRERLKAERDKLNKRLRQIDARETAKKRKEETRLKVIAGAIVLKAVKDGKVMTPEAIKAAALKELEAQKGKSAAKATKPTPFSPPPKCQCGKEMIRGRWKNNGNPVEGWQCASAWIGGTRMPTHDIKAD